VGILARLRSERINIADPQPWLLEMMGRGVTTSSGVLVTPDTALRHPVVYTCVKIISESIAQIPLKVFKVDSDGGKTEARTSPLYDLLHDQPNSRQTSFEWREMNAAHLCLRGNAYNRIDSRPSDGVITALTPLHPDRIRVLMDPATNTLWYEYRPTLPGSKYVFYRQDEMLHFRGLSLDGIMGQSPITLSRESVGEGLAAQEYSNRFYVNDATPSGALSHPGVLNDQAAKRIRQSWEEAHTGLPNSHRVAVLEEGMKFEKIGLSNRDSQILESRKYNGNDICGIFRVPPHLAGILDRATFSNIEQQSIDFVTYCLTPWLGRIESRLEIDLLSAKARSALIIEFVVAGLLRGDLKTRYEAYAIGRNWSWLTPNDVLKFENMNPRKDPGGDIYLEPMNMIPDPADPKSPKPEPPPIAEPAESLTAEEEDAEEAERSATFAPIFRDASERVARKEREAIERFEKRANTVAELVAKVDEFYLTYEKTVERIIAPVLAAYAQARGVASSTATAAVVARGYVSTSRRILRNVIETASDKGLDISQLMQNWEEQRAGWIATELPKLVDQLSNTKRGK
jgi:HK97 family phage portal protein